MDNYLESDHLSLRYHAIVAQKLRQDPDLWARPKENLERWTRRTGAVASGYLEWRRILDTMPREAILFLLVEKSDNAARLRSSSPFAGILSQEERLDILKAFRAAGPEGREKASDNPRAPAAGLGGAEP